MVYFIYKVCVYEYVCICTKNKMIYRKYNVMIPQKELLETKQLQIFFLYMVM